MHVQLFTHNDLDGVSCGILAKISFHEQVQVQYLSVNHLDSHVANYLNSRTNSNGEQVFITDLSLNKENEERVNHFIEHGGVLKLIDHHKTSLHLNDHKWAVVQVEQEEGKLASATSLFYKYLIANNLLRSSKSIDEYVELVRQYDTWEWEKNENYMAKRLNDLLYMQSIEEFEEQMVNRLKDNIGFTFNEFEEKVLDLEEKKTERYIRRKRRELVQLFVEELCIGIVHAEMYHSELGNALGKDYPHLDCIAIVNMGSKKMGFRTIHDKVDVSRLAARFGGGGHAKASGCMITKEAYKIFVEASFLTKPLKEDARHNRMNIKERSAHYHNFEGEEFLIYQNKNGYYIIEKQHKSLPKLHHSFEEAERFLKREFAAGLSKDEKLVDYLFEEFRNRV